MKKLVTFLALGLALVAGQAVQAVDEPLRTTDDVVTWTIKDTTEVALGVSSGGAVYTGRGLINQMDVFIAPPASSTDAFRATGIFLTTITANMLNGAGSSGLVAGGTTFTGVEISSQPTVPRNIMVFSSVTGVGTGSTTISGVLIVRGVDNLGNSAVETISFSTSFPVVSTGVYAIGTTTTSRYGQGQIAWAQITSFTIVVTSVTLGFTTHNGTFNLLIGYGNRLGLSNDLAFIGDVYKINEDSVDQVGMPGRLSSDYNTYTPALAPNGLRSYRLWYRVKNSPRK